MHYKGTLSWICTKLLRLVIDRLLSLPHPSSSAFGQSWRSDGSSPESGFPHFCGRFGFWKFCLSSFISFPNLKIIKNFIYLRFSRIVCIEFVNWLFLLILIFLDGLMDLGFERSSENGFETIVSFWTVRFRFCRNRAAESILKKF